MLKRALLRDAVNGVWLDFSDPVAVLVASALSEVSPVLARVDAYCRQGGYAAGYLSYEAAPAMDPAYECFDSELSDQPPLAVFGLFRPPVLAIAPDLESGELSESGHWEGQGDFAGYAGKIDQIRQEIGAGNLYQVNYTLRLMGRAISAPALFRRIGLGAPYGAYLDLDNAAVVSGSPELFFRLNGATLESTPMKGTIARGTTPKEDAARKQWLERSEKNRAENLMITDMVRNDLGRIAERGSVQADGVFQVQALPTVWQMTSTVRGRTEADLPEIFRGLFPAASITGAPKIASMSLIRELEAGPRGIYTGAIGYVGPELGSRASAGGLSAQFSVAIRTAWIDAANGEGCYGAGGGIVWDSIAEEEFAEVEVKSRVLRAPAAADDDSFELLETIGWSPGAGFDHLPLHLDRLSDSAEHYGFRIDPGSIRDALKNAADDLNLVAATEGEGRWRVRLCLDRDGGIALSTTRIELLEASQPVMLAREPVRHDDERLRFKTTHRGIYQRADSSVPEGVEALLWNDLDRVTESSIANLIYELDGERFTPPVADGLLPGVKRAQLLADGLIKTRSLPVEELPAVDALYLVNGLRGWRQAELMTPGRTQV